MFKKLKSLFVIEEEVPNTPNQAKNVSEPKARNKDTNTEPLVEKTNVKEIFESSASGTVKPAKKFTDILLKSLEKENLKGTDYMEFKESLQSLKKVIPDESTRFKSSYAVLTNNGITKAVLLNSSEHYIRVLNKEKDKFNVTFKAQQNKQIKEREEKINSYQKGIIDRKTKLKQLITEIEAMEKKLDVAKIDINKAAGKVQLTKDQFMASFNMIVDQIQSDSKKINEYL